MNIPLLKQRLALNSLAPQHMQTYNALEAYVGSAYAYSGTVKEIIDSLFDLIPPLEKEYIVWRGVSVNEEKELRYYSQVVVSASLDESIALDNFIHTSGRKPSDNICCLLKIILPPGSRIIPLFHLFADELEVLLPAGSVFSEIASEIHLKNLEFDNDDGVFITLAPLVVKTLVLE